MGFRDDERGQPVLIGFILLFGILVIAFAGYQAFVVPSQNAQVEFAHDQRVQPQFTDIRNGVMGAAATGEANFKQLTLGTQYPTRLAARNPSAPGGTLRTTDAEAMSVVDGDGDGVGALCRGPATTSRLEYRASYNVFSEQPTYVLENTVAYRQFDSGVALPMSSQRLLSENTVNLVPLEGEFSRSGTGPATFEAVGGRVKRTSVTDPTVRVPTRLDEETWNDLLDGELDAGETATVEDGELVLDLSGTYTVRCAAVGVDRTPEGGSRSGGALDGGDVDGINPASADRVVLTGVSVSANGRDVTLQLRNRAAEGVSIEQARLPFFYSPTGSGVPEEGVLNGVSADTLRIGADYESIEQEITVPAEGTTDITVNFDRNVKDKLFGFAAVYDNDFTSEYIVTVRDAAGDDENGEPTAGEDPSVDSVNIADISTGNRDRYEVTAEVSDPDGDLDAVEFELRNPDTGAVIDATSDGSVGGSDDTSTVELQSEPGANRLASYEMVVTVFDAQGNSATVTETVDGSG